MKKTRITVETTPAKKKALGLALKSGLSLQELFDGAIDEVTTEPFIPESDESLQLNSLAELEDTREVLKRLKSVDWSFTDADTGYLSHDIHPYPAKFIPQIPHHLITQLSLRGETVYDPFGGSATSALESLLLGRCPISSDVNPLAELIGKAKTLTLTQEDEDESNNLVSQLGMLLYKPDILLTELDRRAGDLQLLIPAIPNLSEWFHQNAISELAYIRWRIANLLRPNARTLAEAAFSKSIVKASYQDEETRYARKPREVSSGATLRLFIGNLTIALKKVRKLGPLLGFREAIFKTIDLRLETAVVSEGAGENSVNQNSVDLIVTSPPYPNATDYHLYHRFRLFWLGFDPRQLGAREIGSHLRHQKEATGFESYLEEMAACLRNMYRVLRPGRYAVLVLGNAIFKEVEYCTAERVAEVAQEMGFEVVERIARQLHSRKRAFSSSARRLRSEDLLILRKPPQTITFTLLKPPYKLWDHEEDLRRREIKSLLGSSPRRVQDGNLSISTSSLALDKLRKLTFTHGLKSKATSKELTWQAILENGDAFIQKTQRKDPKYATHGIHDYKGKFYPQLAKSLCNLAGLEPGQWALDPFAGSGTVLLECFLNGYNSFGIDLNPLAVKIARAKTQILSVDPYLRDKILSRIQSRLGSMDDADKWIEEFPKGVQTELLSWFPSPVLFKLGWLLHEIRQELEPRVTHLLEVLVSSIVREVSQQDPQDLRIRRRREPLADAPVRELFGKRLSDTRTRLQRFSVRSTRAPVEFGNTKVIEGDCRLPEVYEKNGVGRGSIDAVITSPPYATALPYIDIDRLSLLLLFGRNSRERGEMETALIGTREIKNGKKSVLEGLIDSGNFEQIRSQTALSIISTVHRQNKASGAGFRKQNMAALLFLYFRDMSVAMENLDQVLREGASAFFVIGDNKTVAGSTEIRVRSGRVLQEIGESIGWNLVDVLPISVTRENRRHSKNSITENEIIWFRKGG